MSNELPKVGEVWQVRPATGGNGPVVGPVVEVSGDVYLVRPHGWTYGYEAFRRSHVASGVSFRVTQEPTK